ncbi:MAG: chemotaxis protein chel [Belnapia sp.]|jgi:flagellar protein FlgJ|nr:chemotaxis protein chel [Belnapia sp.]
MAAIGAAPPVNVPLAAARLSATPAALRRTAQAFEAQAMGQLLQPMFATLQPGKSSFGGGMAEAQWQPMLIDAMAKAATAAGRSLGIGDVVLREMLRWQAAGAENREPSP